MDGWNSPASLPEAADAETVRVRLRYANNVEATGFFILPQWKGDKGTFVADAFFDKAPDPNQDITPYIEGRIALIGWKYTQ